MGLDTVELAMEIEEAFGISIPDDRASGMLTVGDVYEFILEETADASLKRETCLTAAAFYELRRNLCSLGMSNRKVRPGTELQTVIPVIGRRSLWRTLAARMDLSFPRLRRPSWLVLLNSLVVTAIVFGCFATFGQSNVYVGTVAAIGGGIAAAAILSFLTLPFAIYPAPTCSTMRGLVTNLVAMNYRRMVTRYSTRSPKDIWSALQLIVAEQLGVDQNAVVPHARFVQDLGAD